MNQTLPWRVLTVTCMIVIAGCATPIPYKNVNFEDGVYDDEILSIAAHELELSPEKVNFSPKGSFINNRFTHCLENHKLVAFPSRRMFTQTMYYVIVDKRSGVVVRSGRMSLKHDSWAMTVRGVDGCYE